MISWTMSYLIVIYETYDIKDLITQLGNFY